MALSIPIGCGLEDPSELNVDPFDADSFIVQGYAKIGSSPATDVHVSARCDGKEFSTTTDHEGNFQMETNVSDCDKLIMEWNKESYLPQTRIIDLPAFTRTLNLEIPLTELEEIQCGLVKCETKFGRFPNEFIKWGWAASGSGARQLKFIPGNLQESSGDLISMVGFSFYDFRDVNGSPLTEMPPFYMCNKIDRESYDWLGDVDRSTPVVEMNWYRFDTIKGMWQENAESAFLAYTLGNKYEMVDGKCDYIKDGDGDRIPNIVEATYDQLPDIRANSLSVIDPCSDNEKSISQFWTCGEIDGNGFYAWGIDVVERSCFVLSAKDQCGNDVRGAAFTAAGRDHGYRGRAWTNEDGKACLEVIASEGEGNDYDRDGLSGERLWVDVEIDWEDARSGGYSIDSYETQKYPEAKEGCSNPDACVQIEREFRSEAVCD